MRQLGLHEFDRAVVGDRHRPRGQHPDRPRSLIDLGVPDIWAKAISQAHGRILTQIGVHHVVVPEHDMGKRVAHLVRGRMMDYIELDDGYAFAKTRPPRQMLGPERWPTSHVRSQHGVTVVGVKRAGRGVHLRHGGDAGRAG